MEWGAGATQLSAEFWFPRDSRTCFETAMVNEPSEFKPLKVNCIFIDIRGYFEISVLKTSFVCLYKLSLLVR